MIDYFVIDHFKIGPIKIYTWGLFIALAFFVGLILAIKAGKKTGIEFKKIIWLVIFIYIGAMIGAKLFFILQSPKDFLIDPLEFFEISAGGMMFYGGLFGGILAGWLYLRKWEKRSEFISALTPVMALAMAIGRVGCLLNNDHQGVVTDVPWTIRWSDGVLRHPVALYLILFDLALFGFLLWFRKYAKWKGQIFLIFLIIYSAGRFLLDFTRDSAVDPHILGLAISQWISISLLTALVICVILKNRQYNTFFVKKRI